MGATEPFSPAGRPPDVTGLLKCTVAAAGCVCVCVFVCVYPHATLIYKHVLNFYK